MNFLTPNNRSKGSLNYLNKRESARKIDIENIRMAGRLVKIRSRVKPLHVAETQYSQRVNQINLSRDSSNKLFRQQLEKNKLSSTKLTLPPL